MILSGPGDLFLGRFLITDSINLWYSYYLFILVWYLVGCVFQWIGQIYLSCQTCKYRVFTRVHISVVVLWNWNYIQSLRGWMLSPALLFLFFNLQGDSNEFLGLRTINVQDKSTGLIHSQRWIIWPEGLPEKDNLPCQQKRITQANDYVQLCHSARVSTQTHGPFWGAWSILR